jgi:hypothetical protein
VHLDLGIAAAGLFVGFVVGMTGMGGGALMTPVLVLLFKIQPLTAISSDLVAAFVMKPVGGAVHLRRGTVNLRLAAWLCAGSVPAALAGVFVIRHLGGGQRLQVHLKWVLGAALLLAALSMAAKAFLGRRQAAGRAEDRKVDRLVVRPLPTLLIGALGGLVVGMTSVGSGSLIIVLLLVLYPTLAASDLVGTDLVQAVPLVGAAALGHLVAGDFKLSLTASLLVGSLPGVYLGARCSSRAPDRTTRALLMVVLTASGLSLVNVPTKVVGAFLLVAAAGAVTVVVRAVWGGRRGTSGPSAGSAALAPTALEPGPS